MIHHELSPLASRFLRLEAVNRYAIKKVPFFLALFAAEQMNAVLTADNLIEVVQQECLLTL